MTTFEKLSAINVNEHVEKKKDLTYLSWAWAWSEVKKACPDATYKVGETDYDEAIGFMCHTTVTIDGETLEMWLPVMDSSNKSMKKIQYTVSTRYGDKTIEAATTFDINKTIMRCLVKNLAMFGLGLYIFAGEDLPESDSLVVVPQEVVLVDLVKDSDNWAKVVKYIEKNKNLGVKEIVQQLGRKYTMSAPIKKEIASLINS
tara:strand:+ start:4953 stop:5558 length:606 start_codon:yes stop_codon:yes gene_type:complete